MLNRQPTVISVKTKPITKLPPPLLPMAVADGNVVPGSILDFLMCHRLQPARQTERSIVQERILCVHMMDCISKRIYSCEGIGAHPEQMTWIEVGAHNLPDFPS